MQRLILIAILGVVAGCLTVANASAAEFNVNSTAQLADAAPGNGACSTAEGTCTLRAALEEANALIGPDVVNVPPGTYPVTTWAPTISQSLVLRGTGGSRVTRFDSGGTAQRWTISGGGTVDIEGVTITGVNGSQAAIGVNGPDTTLRGVSIEGNRSTSSGATGIRIQTADVTMIRSAVTDNLSETNVSQSLGGGIAVMSGSSLVAVASTIARNTLKASGSSAWGGGIYTAGQTVLRHVTLRENSVQSVSAANYGGNLFAGTDSQVSIRDSIIIDGSTSSGQSRNCGIGASAGPFTPSGKNIYEELGSFSCILPAATVASTTTAMTPLGDHGGTGLTYVPFAKTPAVDAASGCPDGGLDQRGVKAPTGAGCDIGAAELNADLRVTLTSAPGPVAPGTDVFHTAVLTNTGLDTATAATLQLTPASGLAILSVSDGSCTATGQCSFGTLTPGMSRAVTFSAKAPASGQLVATASGASETPDPTPEDATASATTDVIGAPAALAITKLRAIGKLRSGAPGRIGFSLSREATVRIVFSRLGKGRRAAGKCRPKARKGKRCQIVKRAGVLTARREAGPATVTLPRRPGGRKLAPGRYRLVATATTPDGVSSKPVRVVVKVLKAPVRRAPAR